MMRRGPGRTLLIVTALAVTGCTVYQPPPLPAAHPANPDAPAAREAPASRTLAYSRADAETIRAAAPAQSDQHSAAGRAGKTVVGEGEVVSTTPASGQIVLDHAEIKGFMEAMTMGYRADPPSLLAIVKPGDKIRFTIDVDRRAIVHIEKLP
jgi:Cu/Ag efflux protein CusF